MIGKCNINKDEWIQFKLETISKFNKQQISLYMIAPYANIVKLMSDQYFPQDSQDQMQVGLKLLEFQLMKIAYYELRDKKIYDKLNQQFPQIIVQQMQIGDTNHLKMCFGQIAKDADYTQLKKIQSQLTKIVVKVIQNNMASGTSIVALDKTATSSYKTSTKSINFQFPHYNSVSHSKLSNIPISSIKYQQQHQNFDQSQVQSEQSQIKIANMLSILELQNYQHDSISIEFNKSHSDNSSQKTKINNLRQIKDMPVMEYLTKQVINHNSELNTAVQKLKLTLGPWKELQEGRTQQNYLIIPITYCGGNQNTIQVVGKGPNKKKAREDAAFKILKQLYEQYPHLYNQIRLIKFRSAIKC